MHQNTSKLKAAQRKNNRTCWRKKKEVVEIRRLRRLLKKRRMYEIRYGTVTYHGLLMLFWSTLREVEQYPDTTTNERRQLRFPAANGGSVEDLGGYLGLLIGSMVPLGNCDALQMANHRGIFGARGHPFCRHQPITACITGRPVCARCTMTAREQQHARWLAQRLALMHDPGMKNNGERASTGIFSEELMIECVFFTTERGEAGRDSSTRCRGLFIEVDMFLFW